MNADHRFIRPNFFLTIIPFGSSFSKNVISMPIQNKNSQPTSGVNSLRELALRPVNEKAPVLYLHERRIIVIKLISDLCGIC